MLLSWSSTRWHRLLGMIVGLLALLGTCLGATSTASAAPASPKTVASSHGFWLVGSDGGVFTFGSANFYGSTGNLTLQASVDGIAATADRKGYWLVASDGGVFTFGDAHFYGSIPQLGLAPVDSPNPHRLIAPIVGIVPTVDGGGYFLVASDGGIFAFGDAVFEGSCYSIGGCASGVNSVVPDASGKGYWLVTNLGTVYAFGDAVNYGSPTQVPEAEEISAVRTPSGNGYWILFNNGEVYTFGDAQYYGSPAGDTNFNDVTSAIVATSDGAGYWVMGFDGKVYPYGDAPKEGDLSGVHLKGDIVAASGA
ncbi:MAG TPA: hypothetical protein VHV57_07695 [Acidimicrobiales bacterium]|jgi:hypothetical protein|nr:hypothetical protein [Acidimicrobiales bacterium]